MASFKIIASNIFLIMVFAQSISCEASANYCCYIV